MLAQVVAGVIGVESLALVAGLSTLLPTGRHAKIKPSATRDLLRGVAVWQVTVGVFLVVVGDVPGGCTLGLAAVGLYVLSPARWPQ